MRENTGTDAKNTPAREMTQDTYIFPTKTSPSGCDRKRLLCGNPCTPRPPWSHAAAAATTRPQPGCGGNAIEKGSIWRTRIWFLKVMMLIRPCVISYSELMLNSSSVFVCLLSICAGVLKNVWRYPRCWSLTSTLDTRSCSHIHHISTKKQNRWSLSGQCMGSIWQNTCSLLGLRDPKAILIKENTRNSGICYVCFPFEFPFDSSNNKSSILILIFF